MDNRTNKGQSLIAVLDDYISLDLETTGLDPSCNEIIEIAAVKVSCGKIVDSFATLVKPPYEVDDFITELTGITNDMLKDAPSLSAVLPSFIEFVGSSVIVGHNVNFDINFIYDSLERFNSVCFSNNFIDTMRLSRRLFKDFENHKLTTLVKNFGVSVQPEHRALADCEATQGCYEYMKQYIASNGIELESLLASHAPSVKACDISATVTEFDESHPLYGKVCVFTGALAFTRKEAMQLVANVGGINADGVNKQTNFLIIGNNDYCTQIKDGKSNKQKKAEAYILAGRDITILSEKAFLDLLKDSQIKADIPIPENQMPAAHYAYACAVSSALASAGVNTEYLRFAVDGDVLIVCYRWLSFKIAFCKKSTYIIGAFRFEDAIKLIPQTSEVVQLSKQYRIMLNDTRQIAELVSLFVSWINQSDASYAPFIKYHPDIAEKRLKEFLNSKHYYRV